MGQEGPDRRADWQSWYGLAAIALLGAGCYVLVTVGWDESRRTPGRALFAGGFMFVWYLAFSGWLVRDRLMPGRFSISIDRTAALPVLPAAVELRGALREADRGCEITTCGGDDQRLSATGTLSGRSRSFSFSVTIDRAGAGAEVVVECSGPRPLFDRGRCAAFIDRLLAALRWRCEETVGV